MRIRIECGLDSRSGAGFWKNDNSRCTNFFSFKKAAKTRCRLDSRIYGRLFGWKVCCKIGYGDGKCMGLFEEHIDMAVWWLVVGV
jgi:hypothetical protein